MPQIKIIKSTYIYRDYYDDVGRHEVSAGSTWLDVDDEMANKLEESIKWANLNTKSDYKYSLIYNLNEFEFGDIFTSAEEVITKFEKEKAKQEKQAADYKAKREATALLRKQKQLQKLKKELGET